MGYKRDKSKEIEEAKNDLSKIDELGLDRFSKFALEKANEYLPGYEFLIHDEKERIEEGKGKPGSKPHLTPEERKKTIELFYKFRKQFPRRKIEEIEIMVIDYWNDKKGIPGQQFKLHKKTIRRILGKDGGNK